MSEQKNEWAGKHYACFTNRECEYLPCHAAADPEHFNCLFCYCPLYALGKKCGGNPQYFGDIKDCSACTFPHRPENYGRVIAKFQEIVAASKKISELE